MSGEHGPMAVSPAPHQLRARRMGIDTQYEAVVFMHKDCPVCRSEGFAAHNRILLRVGDRHIIATLYQVTTDLLALDEAALSEPAWVRLGLAGGETIAVSHPDPVDSLSHVRGRIYGNELSEDALRAIVGDVVEGKYSDIHLSSFITSCAARPLDRRETLALTKAMIEVGEKLSWNRDIVVDKHSVGGLPGNRTTPIIVPIVAALGLTMPKTSSRAITSPAGTADTMETMAPVELDTADIHRVVEQEGGCIAWGGAVKLSPADDVIIRIERALDIDTEGQMIASVLSKKIAAGSTHLVLDLPVGPTAKVRSTNAAHKLAAGLRAVAEAFGLRVAVNIGDGQQPIGRGIGPALEANDVLAVLQGAKDAPQDLRARALALAGALIELGGAASEGRGHILAAQVLGDGRAWAKFQRICEAQGGMRKPPVSRHRQPLLAERTGRIDAIDNRRIAKLAKLAGAPEAKAAGIELHVKLGSTVSRGEPLCTVHAEAPGELAYSLNYAAANPGIISIGEP
ncbi:MAG: thymidine phosphorylase family protein [Hyphomonadaceae bacterium]|nr:thymidine phosphorylase family protein [Hyphomonadaceae bacterium]